MKITLARYLEICLGYDLSDGVQRFGQFFLNALEFPPDSELFYETDRKKCQTIILERYVE